LNEKYVAFYRDQARRLREIERKIERIKAQQQPSVGQRRGFSTKAPSEKTTWLVIWIILGFLAVMALLSMLRWMVRTKADRKLDSTPPPGEA
jgi:endo-1,4-beta-mannosidase